jgi:hypothetical protein
MRSSLAPCLVLGAVWLAPSVARADVSRAQCVESYERAQYLRKDLKLREAREALLVCAQDACPAVTKNDCVPWLAEIDRSIPTVSVAVRDAAGRDQTSAKITLDGAPLAGAAEGLAVMVDPGSHVIGAQVEDGRSAEERIVVRAGERNRVIVLTLGGPAAPPADRGPARATEPPREEPRGRSFALPIVLTAVGLAGVGGAVFFGLSAQGDEKDMRSGCAPRCPQSDIDAAESKLLYSDVALGVGVVALAAATYFWISGASSSPRASAPSVPPLLGTHHGAFAVRF